VADACKREGIRFGVYLSPWDRHDPRYGSGKPYDDYFVHQLTELLTGYGEIFCVWFDGACGEGPNGRKQHYDWERYYQTIRELQPEACISVCGPDIRWCGNEAGLTRESEWSVVPKRMADTEKVASASQQAEDHAFRLRPISARDQDLGSREALKDERDLIWYPAEVNTSIRPGWFWHASEDEKVKPLKKLIDIYEKSVGGNATFLLNIPPTTDGLFHPNDVARLHELGEYIRSSYAGNLLESCTVVTADAPSASHEVRKVLTDDETFYMPRDARKPVTLTFKWAVPVRIDRVVICEQLKRSQRVERFRVETLREETWTEKARGTVIGYKKILVMDEVITKGLRLVIEDSRCAPTIRYMAVYGPQDFSAEK
jgi:alpha-L-fucosidase